MITLREISESLSMNFEGDGALSISGPSEPKTASQNQLALAMDDKFLKDIGLGEAQAALLVEGTNWKELGLKGAIFVSKSRYAVARINKLFEDEPFEWQGIHKSAIISNNAKIEQDVSIGPFTFVSSLAAIGKGGRIGSHVLIGKGVTIGEGALIHSGVKIGPNVKIGDGFICHQNAVIASDGFSFVSPEGGGVEQARKGGGIVKAEKINQYVRIPSLGAVKIGNNVEVGAGSVIDRGTIEDTKLGNGTKLDNLVHLAHNVVIGDNCLICGQVGIAGSAKVGERVVLGGQVGVADHVSIGSDSIVAGKSGVSSNIPRGRFMMGNPAMKIEKNVESYKIFRRLPRILQKIETIEKIVLKK